MLVFEYLSVFTQLYLKFIGVFDRYMLVVLLRDCSLFMMGGFAGDIYL